MSNPDVYPITAAFEAWWEGERDANRWPPTVERLFGFMSEAIGEYEHGSVDWPGDLNQYVEVCRDILLGFRAAEQDEEDIGPTETETWRALASATTLEMLPKQALVATIHVLAERLLEMLENGA